MRKAIAIAVATAFLGLGTAPAFAIIPFLIPVLLSKQDQNAKAVTPAKKVRHHAKHKKM